jgi:cytochrome P450
VSAARELASSITVEELDRDPYPIYARLRRDAPVCLVPAAGLWFVTRWADVEEAATRFDVFAARVDPSPLERTMGAERILLLDGEPQRRLRAMLDPALRPRVVDATAPDLLEPLVAELLDGLEGSDEAELMAEYFEPVSVLGLGRVLGLGHLDGDTLRRWFHGLSEGAVDVEDDPATWGMSDALAAEIDEELAPLFERLHRDPDGSTISTMLALAEGTLEERVATILPTLKVILLGGMREPGHAAGSTLVGLLESRQVRAVTDDLTLVRDAVEEGLRWVSPIGMQTRRAVRDVELGGVHVPAGTNLGLLVSSANRDEDVWGPTADAFDLFRPRRNHAAFGFGPHVCPGDHVSRVQMRIALARLLERHPRLRLDRGRPPEFDGWELRGPQHLHVVLDG